MLKKDVPEQAVGKIGVRSAWMAKERRRSDPQKVVSQGRKGEKEGGKGKGRLTLVERP